MTDGITCGVGEEGERTRKMETGPLEWGTPSLSSFPSSGKYIRASKLATALPPLPSVMACTKNNSSGSISRREPPATVEVASSSSTSALGDPLLLATMCIIGLPVEVQVKDGSVYSGIFHTARADKDYAIVLKKARKICRGSCSANLEVGALIDTLVVLSGDLVQVIAKEVLLPGEGIGEGIDGNGPTDVVEGLSGSSASKDCNNALVESMGPWNSCKTSSTTNLYQNDGRSKDTIRIDSLGVTEMPVEPLLEVENRNQDTVTSEGKEASCASHSTERQEVQDGSQEVLPNVHLEGITSETIGDSLWLKQLAAVQISLDNAIHPLERAPSEGEEIPNEVANCASSDGHVTASINQEASDCAMASVRKEAADGEMITKDFLPASVFDPSTNSASASPAIHTPCSTFSVSLVSSNILPASEKNTVDNTNQKGFKLNPGAKTFLPSYARPAHATPVPAPSTTLNVASAPFVPANAATFMPIGGMQPAVEISTLSSQPSAPTKFVLCNNFSTANYASAPQPRPVLGHGNTRSPLTRPTGHGQQYLPVQMGATYLHPNTQNAMMDRMVQHLYVQPVPQDSIQIPELAPSVLPPRPLLTPYQYNFPKLQPAPAMQLCAAPPVMTGQPQLYAPLAHPLHVVQTSPVPGGNGAYGSKFYP